jgi:hypothetical protein
MSELSNGIKKHTSKSREAVKILIKAVKNIFFETIFIHIWWKGAH